jgi:hypothetical protein
VLEDYNLLQALIQSPVVPVHIPTWFLYFVNPAHTEKPEFFLLLISMNADKRK